MMFKFETIVGMFFVFALASISATTYAARNERQLSPATEARYIADRERLGCAGDGRRQNRNECLRIESAMGMNISSAGNTGEACREAEEKFNSANGKFSGACSGAGLNRANPNADGAGGSLHCSWQKNRCRCNSRHVSEEDQTTYQCSQTEERGRDRLRLDAQSSGQGLIDLNKARKDLEYCPHEDPDDSERYEKQVEKAQERIKDARKKLPELMNKGSEAQDKANQSENDARRKAAEAQKEFANEMREIKRKKESDEQQAVAEVTATREKMDQLDAQIRQLEMSKVDAEVKLSEARTQIELNCHATASQQVAARQTARVTAIRQGQSRGGFNELMNSVGISSRATWEKAAAIYYKRCLNSRPTRDSKRSAQNIYESTLRQVDVAITTARAQRRSIEENLSQIMSTNGCGAAPMQANGMTGESRMCRSLRQAQEDAQQAYQNQVTQQQQIQQEAITARQQQATKNQALSMEYAEAQREINDEQTRLDNLRAYLNLKREKSNGIGGKKAAETLNETYGALVAASENVVSCKNKDEGEVTPETYDKAFKFLKSIGQEPPELPRELRNSRGRTDRPEMESPRTPPPTGPPATDT